MLNSSLSFIILLKNKFLLIILFSVCIACHSDKEEQKTLIGKVDDSYLYLEDVNGIIPKATSHNDSIALLKRYVENWVREKLIIQKAEDNLTDEQKNVDKQLQDYRNSLITYAYEKELIRQHLDTLVTHSEIEKYYNEHTDDFKLKDNIIKVIYVKTSLDAPKIDLLRKLYKSDTPKDREQLTIYCHQFSENFYLNDESWLFFDDLLKEVPIETYNKELFLKNTRFIEVEDSASIYFLNIKGFRIRESLSPLGFEIENIKNIILNKRKLELISKMKENIYKQALNTNKAEIYVNELPEK